VNNEGIDPHEDIFNPDPLPPVPHLNLQVSKETVSRDFFANFTYLAIVLVVYV
jgi:hypothetical protein